MRVFLAGASGAIGKPLLTRLLDAGHEVTALARSDERAAQLAARGAQTAVADALDARALTAAVEAARPEVVINQLTALPVRIDPRKYAQALQATNTLRREAGPVLAQAALQAGARRLISQSVCFMLDPSGPWILGEDAPLYRDPPKAVAPAVEAMRTLERATLETPGLEGIVLRYGFFYGAGSYAAGGPMEEDARKRRLPIVGSGEGRFSFVHVDDAAAATVLALDRGAPGIYHVAGGPPALQREWATELASILGAKPPRRVPLWLGKLAAGWFAKAAVELRGASTAKAERELGFRPGRPDWRAGFAEEFGGRAG